jgi:hypothetical protein
MPLVWLEAYMAQLNVLQAEDNVTRLQIALMATGRMEKAEYTKALRDWTKHFDRPKSKLTKEQFIAMTRAMGMGVKDGI